MQLTLLTLRYISLTESALSSLPIPHTHPNLSQTELKALHTLRKMKDLTIRKADKGSCIVVVDTSSYIDNGIAHLQNTSIYRMLSGDPTNSMSKNTGDFVEYLFNSNYIDKHTHSFLKPPQSPRTQRLYFTKKLHKNPPSIQPTVSGCVDQQK